MRLARSLPRYRRGVEGMIRARWFVVLTVAVVAAIGVVVDHDELQRSDAALGDLGERQAELASIASAAIAVSAAWP